MIAILRQVTHPGLLPVVPTGSRTLRSLWTTSQMRKPKPSEGHRISTGQVRKNACLDSCSAPCSHASPRPLQHPCLLAADRIWPQAPSPPHLHLSPAMESCPAHPLLPAPVDTISPPRTPTPSSTCQNSPGPSGPVKYRLLHESLTACSLRNIIFLYSDLRELRVAANSSAPSRSWEGSPHPLPLAGCGFPGHLGLGLTSESLLRILQGAET